MNAKKEPTGAVRPEARPGATHDPKRPSWALSESYWRGRTLYDISWRDFMALPGVTRDIADDVAAAAEEDWARGVEPKTRRFLFKHGIDRVRPL
jgi:hypothetical protein